MQVTYIVGRDSSPSLRPPPSPEGELTVWVQLELQTCMSSPFSLPTSSISLLMSIRPYQACLGISLDLLLSSCLPLWRQIPKTGNGIEGASALDPETEMVSLLSIPIRKWNSWRETPPTMELGIFLPPLEGTVFPCSLAKGGSILQLVH